MAWVRLKQSAFDDPRLKAIAVYLDAHLSSSERLSLVLAARIASLRPETLCRYFHERTGVAFHDWQCALRTERAAQLILKGHARLQIRAVGMQVGYENKCTFSRVFKRYEGVGPAEFRTLVRAQPTLRATLQHGRLRRFFFLIDALSKNEPWLSPSLTRLAERLAG